MGTSSSRTGNNAPSGGEWRRVRTKVTRFTKTGTPPPAEVLRSFAGAIGGADRATSESGELRTAITTGQNLTAFLFGVSTVGLDKTLNNLGLGELVGKEAAVVISEILTVIAGEGSLIDDAVARAAAAEVIAGIFNEEGNTYDELREDWEKLLDVKTIEDLLSLFIIESIFELFRSHFADRINSNVENSRYADSIEQEIFESLKGMVELEFGEIDPLTFDWGGPAGEDFISRHLKYALEQMEG